MATRQIWLDTDNPCLATASKACSGVTGFHQSQTMNTSLHHPLITELPEHRDAIHALKTADAHFRRLFDEYHDVDKEVVRIEEEIEPASDAHTESLKVRRLRLKDELLRIIRRHEGA